MTAMDFPDWLDPQDQNSPMPGCSLARVSAVHRDAFMVHSARGEARAELTGRLLYGAESPLDLPTVGDWVWVQLLDEDSLAIIHQVVPRQSLLKRKTAGKKIEHQLIAANLDAAFIMQDLERNFNLRRLERYLVMVHQAGIQPVVLLSKLDLVSAQEAESKTKAVQADHPGLRVIAFSNLSGIGLEAIEALLLPRKTYCLLGSSGVGKTSLLNKLLGEEQYPVNQVRGKDGKGRHTTTRRELMILSGGAQLIDTPGMRELGSLRADQGMEAAFDDLARLAEGCFFSDCTHQNEKGCALLAALERGEISAERYNNYLRLERESSFNQMSYLEKRRKDKAFGKMVRDVTRHGMKKIPK